MHGLKLYACLDEIAVVSRVYFNFVILIEVCRHGWASSGFLSHFDESGEAQSQNYGPEYGVFSA